MRFTIQFDADDPRQSRAAELLNSIGRWKAVLITEALLEYGLKSKSRLENTLIDLGGNDAVESPENHKVEVSKHKLSRVENMYYTADGEEDEQTEQPENFIESFEEVESVKDSGKIENAEAFEKPSRRKGLLSNMNNA